MGESSVGKGVKKAVNFITNASPADAFIKETVGKEIAEAQAAKKAAQLPKLDESDTNKKIQAAIAQERRPLGRAATILTQGLDLEDEDAPSKKVLLGA